MNLRKYILSVFCLLLSSCSTKPLLDQGRIDTHILPNEVTKTVDAAGGIVNWGGRIIEIRGDDESTEIEVMSYPLNKSGRPDLDKPAAGRFLVSRSGFLDPLIFDTGKLVSVTGQIRGIRQGRINEKIYNYPVVDAIELIAVPAARQNTWYPHFSIGVGFGF